LIKKIFDDVCLTTKEVQQLIYKSYYTPHASAKLHSRSKRERTAFITLKQSLRAQDYWDSKRKTYSFNCKVGGCSLISIKLILIEFVIQENLQWCYIYNNNNVVYSCLCLYTHMLLEQLKRGWDDKKGHRR